MYLYTVLDFYLFYFSSHSKEGTKFFRKLTQTPIQLSTQPYYLAKYGCNHLRIILIDFFIFGIWLSGTPHFFFECPIVFLNICANMYCNIIQFHNFWLTFKKCYENSYYSVHLMSNTTYFNKKDLKRECATRKFCKMRKLVNLYNKGVVVACRSTPCNN